MSNGPWNGQPPGPQGGPPGWPQSGGGPQGYPPQGPPQPGWPQGRPPYPPQGQPPYQGQPPHTPQGAPGPEFRPAPPPYPPQGGNQPRPPGLAPAPGRPPAPRRGKALPALIVGLVVVAIGAVAALAWWFVRPANVASPAPGTTATNVVVPSSAPATSATAARSSATTATTSAKATTTAPKTTAATTTQATTKAPAGGAVPNLPAEVGGLKSMGTPNNTMIMYADAGLSKVVIALHLPGVSINDAQVAVTNGATVGKWTCGKDADIQDPVCIAASPYNGVIMVSGSDFPAPQLAAWGDELVSKWK